MLFRESNIIENKYLIENTHYKGDNRFNGEWINIQSIFDQK